MSFPPGQTNPDGVPSGDPDLDKLLGIVALLREERLKQELTLRDLTERMKVNFAHLSRVERGLAQPGFIVLLRWCRALNLKFRDLWDEVSSDG